MTGNAAPPAGSYLDLQAGWRLRAIVPLTKSGGLGSAIESATGDSDTKTVTAIAKHDFVGYDTQLYSIHKRIAGVKIRLESSTSTINGKNFVEPQPAVDLFRMPRFAKRVRLVFLQRVSSADHNMAVLGAKDLSSLNRLTTKLEASPQACVTSRREYCFWIPAGIAVRAERQATPGADESDWVPVR
ncbi:MAG TPA: hypothetical protein VHZ55_13905 [Bryobacteraceae bacterium]|nr:hypothetical protein [Bryobacteraceae bacterium]